MVSPPQRAGPRCGEFSLVKHTLNVRRSRGQSTIEYVLMLAFGAIFALKVAGFFNDIFKDGMTGLEQNISSESASGQGFVH